MSIKQLAKKALALTVPNRCYLCKCEGNDEFLCGPCAQMLPQLIEESSVLFCPRCAQITSGGLICGACLKNPPHFDATQAVWRYEFPVDQLIQSLKYRHNLTCANFFSGILAQLPLSRSPDLILPVPLSPTRLRERGFNQAVEIARRTSSTRRSPLALTQVKRRLDTRPQASLPWKEREKNIRGAFECAVDLSGKSILVVDDVMTSGATLNELAKILKAHGAIWVENHVLARALRDT